MAAATTPSEDPVCQRARRELRCDRGAGLRWSAYSSTSRSAERDQNVPNVRSERRTVAAFDGYAAAQHAVDTLSDHGLPVGRVAIVGTGLRYVEEVSRRMTTRRAALSGAGQGVIIGLIFALLFGVFFTVEQAFIALVIYSVGLGLVFGPIIRAVDCAASGGQRDFASTAHMQADRYEVQVESAVAERAAAILSDQPCSSTRQRRRRRKSSPARCRTTSAPRSSELRRLARASSSRSCASRTAVH